ncbi:TonB-dependent receptor plug domain-containing protein [Sphingomonas sp. Y38-1Y]|uniref:TonB-dependent receptor plug domain-containing protein n=1 Tax=Sphingomonas sp. Y38-1Y TaxID=3078265 RepID=UPI0028E555B0|nr:TonB-dependent receptor [Sphingomonas sp. Y38-1Y]
MNKTQISLIALAAASFGAPAFAQTDPSQPARDADGNPIVVTASRSAGAVEAADVPASLTVLSAEDLAERQTRFVSDVLRDVPGLAVSQTGGRGGLTQVRIRGSESNHVLVLVDGIEVSDPYQGEFDFNTLIADDGARIEVLRGQQSSLYGSDAIGGVIHYITATGREAPGISIRAEGGSFGTAAGNARIAGAGETVDYAVTGTLYRTDGQPTARGGVRDVGVTSAAGSAKLSWTPSDNLRLTAVGRYSFTDALTNNSDGDFTSPTFGYTVDSPGVRTRIDGAYGLVRGDLSLLDGRWTHALTGQVADTVRQGLSPAGVDYGNKGRRWKGSYETGLRLGDDNVGHRLTGAVDYEHEAYRTTTPSPFAFQGRRTTENWGFVGQYELTVGDALSAGASVRHDANDRFADTTTWRAQAGYRLPFGLRVRGAYGAGVKNPGYFELFGYSDGRYIGNPNLRPERSEGWEAGVDQEVGTRATIGATYFDNRLKDEIFTTFPAPDFVATPANRTTRSKQHGVEAFVSARPVDQLKIDLAYTYLDAEENGVEEIRRPRHIGSVNVTAFSADKRLSGTFTARYNGRQLDSAFIDPSFVPVTVELEEFVMVNLALDYRLTDAVSLFGRVENLVGERNEEVFSFVGTGRGAYGGVRARF